MCLWQFYRTKLFRTRLERLKKHTRGQLYTSFNFINVVAINCAPSPYQNSFASQICNIKLRNCRVVLFAIAWLFYYGLFMGCAVYRISMLTSWKSFEETSKTCVNREQQPWARIVNVAQRYDIARHENNQALMLISQTKKQVSLALQKGSLSYIPYIIHENSVNYSM